jgi:4-hydroxy 2-oxovalerate aldolase
VGKPVLLIGGGASVAKHAEELADFARSQQALIVHSSMRNSGHFSATGLPQVFCLAGQEFTRLSQAQVDTLSQTNSAIVTPPPPRFRDAIPENITPYQVGHGDHTVTQKLGPITDEPPLDLAVSVAEALSASVIYLAGFDGYAKADQSEQKNARDVQQAILRAQAENTPWAGLVKSVTPTLYDVKTVSLYAHLQVKY